MRAQRNWRAPGIVPLLALLFVIDIAAAAVPPSLREIVRSSGRRPVIQVSLDGQPFEALAPFSSAPYLLWPATAAGDDSCVPYEREAARGWLERVGGVLGHQDFRLRFQETFDWRGDEVWAYGLERDGIALWDARVLLHWQAGRLVGLVNQVPAPFVRTNPPATATGAEGVSEQAYVAERSPTGFRLSLARVVRETTAVGQETTLWVEGRRLRHLVEPQGAPRIRSAGIREWSVPGARFVDQIDIDSRGIVWFSESNPDSLTSFDPATEQFTRHPPTTGTVPDGMMVDGRDVAWTGMYDGVTGLGRLDISTGNFTAIAAPYAGPVMAVPSETTRGTVWITDHSNNKISEYDPIAGQWLQSLDVPTPAAWVVAGTEDLRNGDVYFTEYNVDSLLRKIFGGAMVEIATPAGGGPAFAVYHDGKVYFSQWVTNRLGVYDIASGNISEYAYPVANEPGGPIDVTRDGLIAVGTRNTGYIMVFDPVNPGFAAHAIPSPFSALKDGLRGDAAGNVWFAETGISKVAVLELCIAAAPPALGNVLMAVAEGAGVRLRWSDEPLADAYEGASSETRDFALPTTSIGVIASGTVGLADATPLGAPRIRSYRVASSRCGVRSGF